MTIDWQMGPYRPSLLVERLRIRPSLHRRHLSCWMMPMDLIPRHWSSAAPGIAVVGWFDYVEWAELAQTLPNRLDPSASLPSLHPRFQLVAIASESGSRVVEVPTM